MIIVIFVGVTSTHNKSITGSSLTTYIYNRNLNDDPPTVALVETIHPTQCQPQDIWPGEHV
jgi:hypothetical protein